MEGLLHHSNLQCRMQFQTAASSCAAKHTKESICAQWPNRQHHRRPWHGTRGGMPNHGGPVPFASRRGRRGTRRRDERLEVEEGEMGVRCGRARPTKPLKPPAGQRARARSHQPALASLWQLPWPVRAPAVPDGTAAGPAGTAAAAAWVTVSTRSRRPCRHPENGDTFTPFSNWRIDSVAIFVVAVE